MALRVLWDKYETALLIDAWLAIERGEVSRREAISKLSKGLRARAVARGIAIDDTYRNENGITLQLSKIDSLMKHQPEAVRHNSQIFIDMVDMYFNDRRQFDAVLSEAKGEDCRMITNEDAFAKWLAGRVSPGELGKLYLALPVVEDYAHRKKLIVGSIYTVTDPGVTARILNTLNSDHFFRITHRKQMHAIVGVAQLYHQYTKELQLVRQPQPRPLPTQVSDTAKPADITPAKLPIKPEPAVSTEVQAHTAGTLVKAAISERSEPEPEHEELASAEREPEVPVTVPQAGAGEPEISVSEPRIEAAESEVSVSKILTEADVPQVSASGPDSAELVVDFDSDTDFSFIKPVSLTYFGQTAFFNSWRQLYIRACRLLYEDYPLVFEMLRSQTDIRSRGGLIYRDAASIGKGYPAYIAEGYFVNGNCSTSVIVRNLKTLLDACNVSYDNIIIRYTRNTAQKPPAVPRPAAQPETGHPPQLANAPSPRLSIYSGSADVEKTKAAFADWLVQQGFKPKTSSSYIPAILIVDNYAQAHGLLSDSIYRQTDADAVISLWNALQADAEFMAFNAEHHRRFSAAMKQYISFLGADAPASPRTTLKPTVPEPAKYVKPAIHPVQTEFEDWLVRRHTRPDSAHTYGGALKRLGDELMAQGLEDRPIFSISGIARLEGIRDRLQDDPDFAARSNVYRHMVLWTLEQYIEFRKNGASDVPDDELSRQYTEVLKQRFENGYRPTGTIDLSRFKLVYAGRFGSEPPEDDAQLLEHIERVGQLRDDRIFARDADNRDDLLDDIQAEIAHAFRGGASCVFVSAVFGRWQHELASRLQIYTEDALRRQLLDTCCGDYAASGNYFFSDLKNPDAKGDVAELLKNSPTPLTYEQLREKLWYLPFDIIRNGVTNNKDIVSVAKRTFFWARNLPISETELAQLERVIHERLTQQPFITDDELRALIREECPSVAINTEAFTCWGLYEALSVVLRDSFAFEGRRITERGEGQRNMNILESFCTSRERMTLEELNSYVSEMNASINWKVIFRHMLRISPTEFVRRDTVDFPVAETDAALDGLIDGEYMPLSAFTLFLHLPPIGIRWNTWVLEGYVGQYSKQFKLLHVNYTGNDCCGAIVRRSGGIRDFNSLLADVLAHSDNWQTEDDALTLLAEQGYLARKQYKNIPNVIAQAKRIRARESET